MIRTGCILTPRGPNDGLRASVMSRHTLSDGVTPDLRITAFDEWWRDLAPPNKLVGAYYKHGLPWAEFEAAYKDHLRGLASVEWLLEASQRPVDVTLLCIEPTPERCHRRLLAEHVAALGGLVGTLG